MTEQQKQSLTKEFNGLNLTKFIQEAVTAIVEGLHKLKVSDVSIVVHMCGLFHQRYSDFMGIFITELMKMFDNYNCKDDEKVGWWSDGESMCSGGFFGGGGVVLCAGVLPEFRLFFTSRSRSCCTFLPAPAGKSE